MLYDGCSMPLAANTRLGPYEIVAPLGAGGMGEVFRARDTRLDRTVAIKICTGHFTERFEREARAISSLNHPHICALYDIGREGTVEFLVMEYLEGESLEARLRKGPLPIEEALQIAIQIASALDAAHRRGMVHRDLKPGNVMLTKGGAKLLDFGLAKVNAPAGISDTDVTQLTPHRAITVQGTILGTLQYMSPEQLEGKEADARSDIFSFGAMLYEMITGRKGFAGSSQATLIAAVMMTAPPPVSTLQPTASPALDRLVRKCLAKSPDDRWQNAGDLFSELEWILETGSEAGVPAPVAAKRRSRERMAWFAVGLAAVLLAASLVWIAVHLRNEPALPAMARFQISIPDKMRTVAAANSLAVSPDGQRIAFTASDGTLAKSKLFVRPLNALDTTEIATPGFNPIAPFWSPDGRQIAFTTQKGELEKVDISGGPPVAICNCGLHAGTWNLDGVILSTATTSTTALVVRVPASGGDANPLWPLAAGETGQLGPYFLPDGKHYLYYSESNQPGKAGIYVNSIDANDRRFVVATGTHAIYAQGQLLFTRGDVLMAQPFDPGTLKLSGDPRPVADHIEKGIHHNATFSASPNGVLVWRQTVNSSQSSLQWFDRSGRKLNAVGGVADYSSPQLSPDDSKLAVDIRDPKLTTRDIWIFDLLRGTQTRLTFDPADDMSAAWSPDGTRIAFSSDRAGQKDIYSKPADGSGAEELLLGGKGGDKFAGNWSRDGKYLMYSYQTPEELLLHLYVLPLSGDRKPVPFVNIKFVTGEGQISPNGRWVAYRSLESGKNEVYVQGFNLDPSQPRGKWQVSTAGGDQPRWRSDGKEMFYHLGDTYYAVDVKTDGKSFEAGIPKPLFAFPIVLSLSGSGSPFVVTRDGQRFLVLAPVEKTGNAPLEVLLNWH